MTIKIFQNEINDGVSELVKSTASVAYCSEAVQADAFKVSVISLTNVLQKIKIK
jgi:hypothetical protein